MTLRTGFPRSRLPALCLLAAACALWLAALPAGATQPRNVLMLSSNSRLLPANIEFDRGLAEVFAAQPDVRVELSVEFLDAPRFSGDAYGRTVATYLREKYAAHPPEVVVVGGDEALAFALRNRAQMFPGVPVVYQAVSTTVVSALAPLPDDVIGAAVELDFLGSVEQALRWQPGASRLVLVSGTSDWDRAWEARTRKEAVAFEGRLSLEFLAGLPA